MARRIGLGSQTARRTSAGVTKVSMTLPAELAWRLGVKSKMSRQGLGEMCAAALWPLVEAEQMPWDRYKPKITVAQSDGPPVTNEGSPAIHAVELGDSGETKPAAPTTSGSGGGEKGRRDPKALREKIERRKAG